MVNIDPMHLELVEMHFFNSDHRQLLFATNVSSSSSSSLVVRMGDSERGGGALREQSDTLGGTS